MDKIDVLASKYQRVLRSSMKNPVQGKSLLNAWTAKIQLLSNRIYEEIVIETGLGKTQIYALNTHLLDSTPIVILPGFRTSSLIWDLDGNLGCLPKNKPIFLVEINGQPNLSDGYSPRIKSLDYGCWCNEVLEKLNIKKADILGASFGGLVGLKLAITNPEKIKSLFLLNSAGLQSFSFAPKNLYFNLLPVVAPSRKNIEKFLDIVIFSYADFNLSQQALELLIEYLHFALKDFKLKAQTPYFMGKELANVQTDVYLIQGTKDSLFPSRKSIENAKKFFPSSIKNITLFEGVGHGIELYKPAIEFISEIINTQKT